MKPYKNRVDLRRKNYGLYMQLKMKRPEILETYLPSERSNSSIEKLAFLKMCKAGDPRPAKLKRYINKGSSYDEKFRKQIGELNPEWLINPRGLKAFKRLMMRMPENVSFEDTYRGYHIKHRFRDSEFGYFLAWPDAILKSWGRGMSGHPSRRHALVAAKKWKRVINLDTGQIYHSLKEASIKTVIHYGALSFAATGKTKTSGGYRWAYCDENGKVIPNNKGRKK